MGMYFSYQLRTIHALFTHNTRTIDAQYTHYSYHLREGQSRQTPPLKPQKSIFSCICANFIVPLQRKVKIA